MRRLRLATGGAVLIATCWLVPAARAQPGNVGFGPPLLGYGPGGGWNAFGTGSGYGFGPNLGISAPYGGFYGNTPPRSRVGWGAAGYYNSGYAFYGAPAPAGLSGAYSLSGYGVTPVGPYRSPAGTPAVWVPGAAARSRYPTVPFAIPTRVSPRPTAANGPWRRPR